jgi:hypothetical protein
MKTPIKHLEESLVYLQRLIKAGDIRESGIYNLDKAIEAIQRAHDALLIEELEK